jgi:predicted SPOUT superfamily RNA methylase MTH1
MALPSSLISKVQSKELKTYVCGQIARAACLYSIDEIVVYNDTAVENKKYVSLSIQHIDLYQN